MITRLKSKWRNRLAAIVHRKTRIENMIDEEMRKRSPCSLKLQHLKSRRLQLKDWVEVLRLWSEGRNLN